MNNVLSQQVSSLAGVTSILSGEQKGKPGEFSFKFLKVFTENDISEPLATWLIKNRVDCALESFDGGVIIWH